MNWKSELLGSLLGTHLFLWGCGRVKCYCNIILFWRPLLRCVPLSDFYFYTLWCRVVTILAFYTEDAIIDFSPVPNDIFLLMFTALPFVLFLLWLFMLLFLPITFVPLPFFPYIKSCQCLLCLWSSLLENITKGEACNHYKTQNACVWLTPF